MTFSLSDDSDSAFSIDAASGEVTFAGGADYESQSAYNFGVIATDAAGNASEAKSVTLSISNLDEVAPTITSSDIASVLQGAGANAQVYQATADDSADTSDGFSFSLAGVDAAEFEIDAETGAVILKADPNDDASREYNFDVIATDYAGNQSEAKSVVLSIIAQDLVAPVFTSPDSAAAVDENSGSGQVVYTATTTDETVVTYSLAGDDADKFAIDSSNGQVTLIGDPDYESQSEYSFDIIASDSSGNTSDPKTVTLGINNLDEAAPTITSGSDAGTVDENGAAQVVYTATADDSGDISGGVTFSLSDDSDSAFSIDAASGEVTFAGGADYEAQSEYNFAVVATDAAGNASEPQSVTLSISNLDDAAPTITSGSDAGTVDENGAAQVVYTATADDSGDISGGVTFSLSDDSDSAFSIDAASGEVTFAGGADYETQSAYNFGVIATDAAGNASEAKSVTLSISNLDEAAPTITSGSDAGTVDENGAAQVVYTATADDNGDISGGVTFSLSDDSDSAFSIDAASGEVTFAGGADYEAQSAYNFGVIATDAAGNASEAKSVTLSISNLDDAAPTITSGSDAGTVDENGAAQVVYTATADDSGDISGGVTFSLSDDSDSAFSIDAASGEVTFAGGADFESQSAYNFGVIATDAAGNASEAKSVTLSISNLDEVAPTITSGSDAGTVDENGAAQVVYTATADDSGDISNGVSYSLYQNTESFAAPTPAEGTQHLYVSEASLSENDTKLTVKVSYDSLDPETAGLGLRVHYDSAALTLDSISDALVADLVFTNPESSADSDDFDENANTDTYVDAGWASIYGDWPSETLPAGIMTLTFDVNPSAASTEIGLSSLASPVGFGFDGPSQTVSLSSNVGDTLGAFSIDSASGEVTFAGGADYEAQSEYNFAVVATDAAGNASEPQSVTLSISNLDDAAPTITSGSDAGTVDENGAAQVVYTATADDSGDISGGVTFSLSDDSDSAFSIDAASGEVTFAGGADYESQSEYNFGVIATDAAGNASEAQSVTLSISNLDEVAPTITSGSDAGTVDENGAAQVVYTATADDSGDISGGVTFSLSDDSDSAFSIDAASGEVTFAGGADYETQSAYNFGVIATDAAGNVSTSKAVNLDVNAPLKLTTYSIDENSGAGQIIATVDNAAEGETFSLVGADDAPAPVVVYETVISIPEQEDNTQHVYVSESTVIRRWYSSYSDSYLV